jgi:hypothetical protein
MGDMKPQRGMKRKKRKGKIDGGWEQRYILRGWRARGQNNEGETRVAGVVQPRIVKRTVVQDSSSVWQHGSMAVLVAAVCTEEHIPCTDRPWWVLGQMCGIVDGHCRDYSY